jgi:hypothetical protein
VNALDEFNRMYEDIAQNATDNQMISSGKVIGTAFRTVESSGGVSDDYYDPYVTSSRALQRRPLNDDMAARRQQQQVRSSRNNYINNTNFNNNGNNDQIYSNGNNDQLAVNNRKSRSLSHASYYAEALGQQPQQQQPHHHTQNQSSHNSSKLILPSPTCADYLRNKTRESALINVVTRPTAVLRGGGGGGGASLNETAELNQILYDDMAYRQLRKDSDVYKIAQYRPPSSLLTSSGSSPLQQQLLSNYYDPSGLTSITTLPTAATVTGAIDDYCVSSGDSASSPPQQPPFNYADYLKNYSHLGGHEKSVRMLKQKTQFRKNNYENGDR